MNFHPQESIALFIDGPNVHSSARALGFDIDYRKLLELFGSQGRLVRAFYYTALLDDQEYSPLRPLVDWLDYNGYTMVTKPAKEFTDAMGHRRIKGNMDIEIAIDMMEMGKKVDHIVLFSGDGDFRRLIEAVQREGVRVSVVSTLRTSPSMVADELRRQTDAFIELQDLAPQIARTPRPMEGRISTPAAARIGHGGCRLTRRRRRRRRIPSAVFVLDARAARMCRRRQPPPGLSRERTARARR